MNNENNRNIMKNELLPIPAASELAVFRRKNAHLSMMRVAVLAAVTVFASASASAQIDISEGDGDGDTTAGRKQSRAGGPITIGTADASTGSIAIGTPGEGRSKHVTTAGGNDSIAIGQSYTRAWGKRSIALGRDAEASKEAKGGIAIGLQASVTVPGGIAIGQWSKADRPGGNLTEAITDKTVKGKFGAMDIGSRQITGVIGGTESTDAANVGQVQSGLNTATSEIASLSRTTTASLSTISSNLLKATRYFKATGNNSTIIRAGVGVVFGN